ncbi:transcription factor AP-4 [Chrysoperla carnea]|uniref:transcription factor AP-4 n=1 Tax=Chrysoperla carnea TaxID=189513 RepID=UPI001D0667F8|nr:transcription factor AP-4 [Chrysoperla carnea]
MSINIKTEEVIIEEVDLFGNFNRVKSEEGPELTGGGGSMEAEKRIRREIANSNERRRMQSINAGFQSLRTLLPHHEGEKLSKAAILQQTAEYIYSLEQEKTRLLSQNSQLKRLVNQHEGNEIPTKKRKHENTSSSTPPTMTTISTTVISESADEGIDTMSPEPVGISVVQTNANIELMEVRAQLERERRMRILLEEELRALESQVVYSSQVYQTNGDNAVIVSLPDDMEVVSMESVPPVAQTQTVESSPQIMSRSPSPQLQQRLPSALEAAIKAEPKVEVERLPPPSPTPSCPEEITSSSQTHLYVHANTSRQNLETIVEAIRHLEGEIFDDTKQRSTTVVSTVRGATPSTAATQEVPLALTTKPKEITQRLLNPYLQFHPTVQQQQQTRPGVIVVKSHS